MPPGPAGGAALRVVPATADQLRALLRGKDAFRDEHDLTVVDGYLEFEGALERSLAGLADGAAAEWSSYLFIHLADTALIGFGGFKGPPVDSTVEIGYGIAPAYRGRGYATEAAGALLERAQAAGVSLVLAHTLAEPNASTRVLQHLGFRRAAVPDEGSTWRWEKRFGS